MTTEEHTTGEQCPGCDSELVISAAGTVVVLDCDCGSVAVLGSPSGGLPTAA